MLTNIIEYTIFTQALNLKKIVLKYRYNLVMDKISLKATVNLQVGHMSQ